MYIPICNNCHKYLAISPEGLCNICDENALKKRVEQPITRVVNLRKEPYDVYIGRAGKGQDGYFGNPFPLLSDETRGATIEKYREYFNNKIANDPEFKRRIHLLKGITLGCFCKPKACHGDVIAEYLNNLK